jgi:hypothetical protein
MMQQLDVLFKEPLRMAPDNTQASSISAMPPSEIGSPATLSEELESAARRVRSRLKNMSSEIIEIGRELRTVKHRLEHGHFLEWVEKQCGLSPRIAQLMMKAAEWAEGRCEIVTHLEPTAIYLLAAPSTPESVREEVLSRLEEGQTPGIQLVKDMIRATKEHKRASREENGQREASSRQYDGRHVQTQPESQQGELRELQDWGSIGGEQAAATNELIEMLLAWDRFDEFTALLKEADISSFVQALRDHSRRPDIGAVTDPWAGHPGLIPFVSREAVSDNTADDCVKAGSEAAPPALPSASSELPVHDRSDGEAAAAPAIIAPQPPASVFAEELIVIFESLKPNTQWRGLQWVTDGCPIARPPDEHFMITESLMPFRAAASNASAEERQRFLSITASQVTDRFEEPL